MFHQCSTPSPRIAFLKVFTVSWGATGVHQSTPSVAKTIRIQRAQILHIILSSSLRSPSLQCCQIRPEGIFQGTPEIVCRSIAGGIHTNSLIPFECEAPIASCGKPTGLKHFTDEIIRADRSQLSGRGRKRSHVYNVESPPKLPTGRILNLNLIFPCYNLGLTGNLGALRVD